MGENENKILASKRYSKVLILRRLPFGWMISLHHICSLVGVFTISPPLPRNLGVGRYLGTCSRLLYNSIGQLPRNFSLRSTGYSVGEQLSCSYVIDENNEKGVAFLMSNFFVFIFRAWQKL